MKNIINLTKIYTSSLFFQSFNSKKNSKSSIILVTLLVSILVCAGMGYSYYSLGESFKQLNQPQIILLLGLLSAGIFVLFFTVYQQQGVYFKTNDFEYLESLPIKKVEIVISKFFSSYLLSLFFHSIFLLPAYVVYFIYNPITAQSIIFALISFLFAPAFVNFIGNILTIIINFATGKLKNRNIITSILTLIFTLFLVITISMASNDTITNMFSNGQISIWIKIFLPYISTLYSAITTSSFLQFLLFVFISVLAIVLSILLLALTYKKLNTYILQSNTKIKVKNKNDVFKEKSVFKDLINKEFKFFINTPIYFVNCIMGAIMTVAVSIILALSFKSYTEITNIAISIFTFINIMMIGVASPSSVSINVEGEKNYVVKSLPISFKTFAMSKIIFSIVLYLPFVILSNILFFAILQPNSIFIISLSIIIQFIALVMSSILGLLINLRFPNLKWINITQAVKQSLSTFVCLIINMIISCVPMITSFLLGEKLFNNFTLILIIAISAIVYLILLLIYVIILKRKGQKMFDKI